MARLARSSNVASNVCNPGPRITPPRTNPVPLFPPRTTLGQTFNRRSNQ
uniref:Uncharacterized protein n=1 Tax=Arundo donax TaxID=35708 RepID=A0A0A9AGP6_ARUDO